MMNLMQTQLTEGDFVSESYSNMYSREVASLSGDTCL